MMCWVLFFVCFLINLKQLAVRIHLYQMVQVDRCVLLLYVKPLLPFSQLCDVALCWFKQKNVNWPAPLKKENLTRKRKNVIEGEITKK